VFHLLKSHVIGMLVLYEKLSHRLHHGANFFVANALYFSSPATSGGGGGGGGCCPCFEGVVNRK
jgi:hypothetical protein